MSMITSRQAAVATTAAGATAVVLPALRNVINQVLEERANNIAFRQAVSDHERDSIAEIQAPAKQLTQVAQSRGGGGRGGGASSMTPVSKADLRVTPRNDLLVPKSVPRSVQRVVWDVVKIRSVLMSASTGVVETNFSVTFSSHPQQASWAALFDQYCIPQFSMSFYSLCPPGNTNQPPIIHTALDLDNTTNLGSLQLIDDFGSCRIKLLSAGQTFVRSVRPAVKVSANSVSGAVQRSWLDCAFTTIPHNGIRTIIEQSAAGSVTVVVETTIWFAFRNSI